MSNNFSHGGDPGDDGDPDHAHGDADLRTHLRQQGFARRRRSGDGRGVSGR